MLVDYDPIKHLNSMFTQPSHLASVAEACVILEGYSSELDDEVVELVRRQDMSNTQSIQRIQAAKTDMADLFQKIEDVRERAMKTEQTITEMTAEIKNLDNAKRNLTLSMTTLKRLQMLTTAYEQLSAMSKTRQYGECAQLLQAVLQLMAHFKSYRSVDQVAALSRNVSDIQHELINQICEDFESAFTKGDLYYKKSVLAEGCQVIDVLGDSARSRLITWYCNTQLREYRQIFRGNDEAGSLDNMSRRYAWLKRLLKAYDEEHASIFPSSWKVNSILTNVFCEGTRDEFKGILARSTKSGGQSLDVSQLLSYLQETLDFEQFLDRKLVSPSRRSMDTFTSSQEQPVYNQSISEAFKPYLSLWIEDQDKQLASLIRQYKLTPLKQPEEEFNPQLVISSSTELFTFYRLSLTQCAKLSTGNSLAELFKVFAKYLDQYAQQILLTYIMERANNPSLSLEDIVMVINTADYCYTTTNQLEEKIRGRIDEPFKQQVDLQNQADAFMGIASSS
ncbi:Vacuolar protein sorting-associated protein 53, partial [Ascosphaera aggregata]